MHGPIRLNSMRHSLLLRAVSLIKFMFRSNKWSMATLCILESLLVSPWIFIVLFSVLTSLSSTWSRWRKGDSGWIASSFWSHRNLKERIEKIIRESAFHKKIKNRGLKCNPELALTGVRTTGSCSQGAFPGEQFTTIQNIVETVIC